MVSNALVILRPADAGLALPLMAVAIRAGFPSPADDYVELALDLNKELVTNPNATFYARVAGTSMVDAGIDEGDILVIDRSREAKNGGIAVCCIDGEFTVKEIRIRQNKIFLIPHNKKGVFPEIEVTEDNELIIWGMVTYVIKKTG